MNKKIATYNNQRILIHSYKAKYKFETVCFTYSCWGCATWPMNINLNGEVCGLYYSFKCDSSDQFLKSEPFHVISSVFILCALTGDTERLFICSSGSFIFIFPSVSLKLISTNHWLTNYAFTVMGLIDRMLPILTSI